MGLRDDIVEGVTKPEEDDDIEAPPPPIIGNLLCWAYLFSNTSLIMST